MKTHNEYLAILSILAALLIAAAAHAQIMGPPLKDGEVELGYIHKWFHRDMEPNYPTEMRWEVATFFARYGGLEWLTLSLEGYVSNVEHEEFTGLSFKRYALGAGLTARLYQYRKWGVSGCLHLNEVWDQDHSSNHFDKRTRGIIGGLQVGHSFEFYRQAANVWAGPVYVKDIGENYPWGTNTPIKNDSSDNLGFALGAHALLFRHITGIFYVVYADYFQARFAVALRLGGEDDF